MASDDYYDSDEKSSDDSDMDMEKQESDTAEEKMGLVPLSFFKKDVKPGDTEKVKVLSIQDGEAIIKCVYGGDKDDGDDGGGEEDMSSASSADEAEDSMMA